MFFDKWYKKTVQKKKKKQEIKDNEVSMDISKRGKK